MTLNPGTYIPNLQKTKDLNNHKPSPTLVSLKKPKAKTVQVALYLPADWLKDAKIESMNSGIRVNQVLLNWIKKAKSN